MDVAISEDYEETALLNGSVRLCQPKAGFRTSIDAVFLAAALRAEPGHKVLDMGCGVGAVFLCLAYRIPSLTIDSVEIQEKYANLARKSTKINAFKAEISIYNEDVRVFSTKNPNFYDKVVTNPPFLSSGAHMRSPDPAKASAMGYDDGDPMDVREWLGQANKALKPGGDIAFIHRADHVQDVLTAMRSWFGGVELIPLWPKAGREAKRVIIRAKKGSKAPSRILPGLVIHEDDGAYTRDAEAILRHGQPLA